ncbi:MAG: hypothetical protein IKG95_01190 [Bacteroidales bacterium]|nr:hypothetical protein [Bacteroidales bacterium]
MKRFQNIVLLVLIALAGNAFGQETGWEFHHLQGKVKTFAEYDYEFDISDSINHDEFMRRFYLCGFDVDKMLRFADSIRTEKDSYHHTSSEYDSLGQFTKLHDSHFINEYDEYGHILNRRIVVENEPIDTIFFEYDEVGRLVKRKYQNRIHQWRYDLDSRLLEYIYKDTEMDSVLILEKYDYDKEGVLKKKESFDNRKEGNRSGYCEYDSKGNVVFERTYNWGIFTPYLERTTSYQYDRNDSIIKETRRETRWVSSIVKDTVWKEIDSIGQVVEHFGITTNHSTVKMESNYVKMVSRNEEGFPIEEVFEKYEDKVSSPYFINKKKYDDRGRVVDEEKTDKHVNPGRYKRVWKYFRDTEFWSYYAVYLGENLEFEHESLFFYDEHGNCIAHIQWMPGNSSEYYFNVNRYEYYE